MHWLLFCGVMFIFKYLLCLDILPSWLILKFEQILLVNFDDLVVTFGSKIFFVFVLNILTSSA